MPIGVVKAWFRAHPAPPAGGAYRACGRARGAPACRRACGISFQASWRIRRLTHIKAKIVPEPRLEPQVDYACAVKKAPALACLRASDPWCARTVNRNLYRRSSERDRTPDMGTVPAARPRGAPGGLSCHVRAFATARHRDSGSATRLRRTKAVPSSTVPALKFGGISVQRRKTCIRSRTRSIQHQSLSYLTKKYG